MRVRSASSIDVCMRIRTKTVAIRIFRSARIATFGGLFFPIVHLCRLGSNGFLLNRFLSIDSCKNYVVPRGVQRNSFSKHLLDAHPTLGSPLNNGDIFWFNKYVYLFLCNEDYSVANFIIWQG